MKDTRKQYDAVAEVFSANIIEWNQKSRDSMYEFVGKNLSGKKILDLACGNGLDAEYYQKLGAKVTGADISKELLSSAKKKYPHIEFVETFAEELPFKDASFDCVFSKYALMTSADMSPIFSEIHRVLKRRGVLIYLVTHPFRQFLEKKNLKADYFKQEIVDSIILNATVTLREPTHTMNEYFNADFFSKFEMVDYIEQHDPAAEKINDATYPGFFIVKAKKK